MTYAQYSALVDGHNVMADPKRRRRRQVQEATAADIAALKQVRVANG
jgi:hypothetical protein